MDEYQLFSVLITTSSHIQAMLIENNAIIRCFAGAPPVIWRYLKLHCVHSGGGAPLWWKQVAAHKVRVNNRKAGAVLCLVSKR